MRYIIFSIILAGSLSSCAADSGMDNPQAADAENILVSPIACLCYGLVAGLLLAAAAQYRQKQSAAKKRAAASRSGHTGSTQDAMAKLEQRYYQLEADYRKARDRSGTLERELAEYKRLAEERTLQQPAAALLIPADNAPEQSAAANDAGAVTLYFLQPTRDGWFMDTGRIGSAADALYALRYERDHPEEASLTFIDRTANVSLAIQNEQNWILVACDPVNLPLADTGSIRTDVPGKALWRNGAWEIVQKAVITYVG